MMRRTIFGILWLAPLIFSDSNDGSDYKFTSGDTDYQIPQIAYGPVRFKFITTNAPLSIAHLNESLPAIELLMLNYLKDDGLNVDSVKILKSQVQELDGSMTNTKISRPGHTRRRSLTQNAEENTHDGRELEQTHYTTEFDMEGVTIYLTNFDQQTRNDELRHQLQAAIRSSDDNSIITVGNTIIEEIILLWEIENYTLAPTEEPSSIVLNEVPTPVSGGEPTQSPKLTAPRPSVPDRPQDTPEDTSNDAGLKVLLSLFGGLGAVTLIGGALFLKRLRRRRINKQNESGLPSSAQTELQGAPYLFTGENNKAYDVDFEEDVNEIEAAPSATPRVNVPVNIDEIRFNPNNLSTVSLFSDDVSMVPSDGGITRGKIEGEGVETMWMVNRTTKKNLYTLEDPRMPPNAGHASNPRPYNGDVSGDASFYTSSGTLNYSAATLSTRSLMCTSGDRSSKNETFDTFDQMDYHYVGDPTIHAVNADDNMEQSDPSNLNGATLRALGTNVLSPLAILTSSDSIELFSDHGLKQRSDTSTNDKDLESIA